MRNLSPFHRRLHRWYQTHGRRDLPWRNTPDAYAIYLSEVMLQQTQVKTVLERFYFQFLTRFPTLQTLADATQDEVLGAWQGLGYYSRARNLQKAAQLAGKTLPKTVESLIALPGIGKNTAHAIAAFAYHLPVPVMEANVKRVLCRIFALKNPSDAELWDYANQMLDRKNPFDYNQAMMDIGAMVCTKRKPDCPNCPAKLICKGRATPELYPAMKVKKKVPVRKKNILVQHDGAGYYLATPRQTRFLHGLYHFTEEDELSPPRRRGSIREGIPAYAGMTYLGSVSQIYSHFTLEADVFLHKIPRNKSNVWFSLKELHDLPMSMAEKKILQLLS